LKLFWQLTFAQMLTLSGCHTSSFFCRELFSICEEYELFFDIVRTTGFLAG